MVAVMVAAAAGRRRLEIELVVPLQGEHAGVGRRAVVRIGHGLAVEVRHPLDRRVRRHVPEHLVAAGKGAADDAHRRTLGKHADRPQEAHAGADLGAVGDHRLLGLAAAVGIEDVEHDFVLVEQAGLVADLGDEGLADAAAANRDLEPLLGLADLPVGQRCNGSEPSRHQPCTPHVALPKVSLSLLSRG
jgi:hypothetical protein